MKKLILIITTILSIINCGCKKEEPIVITPSCKSDTIVILQNTTYVADQCGYVTVSFNNPDINNIYRDTLLFTLNNIIVYNDFKPDYYYFKVDIKDGDTFKFITNCNDALSISSFYHKTCY